MSGDGDAFADVSIILALTGATAAFAGTTVAVDAYGCEEGAVTVAFAVCVVEAGFAGAFLGAAGSTTTVDPLAFSVGRVCDGGATADAGFTFTPTGELDEATAEFAGGVAGFEATTAGATGFETAIGGATIG